MDYKLLLEKYLDFLREEGAGTMIQSLDYFTHTAFTGPETAELIAMDVKSAERAAAKRAPSSAPTGIKRGGMGWDRQ